MLYRKKKKFKGGIHMGKKIVIIGAGQTGRGFIARLLKQSKQSFDFIDRNKELVDLLNKEKQYKVSFYDSTQKSIEIDGFTAFHTEDKQAITVLSDADMVFTAIGEQNLDKLIPLINKSLSVRKKVNKMIIMTCENGTSPKLRLSKLENQVELSESIIFCTTLVKNKGCLDILSENVNYLPYDLEPLSTQLHYHGMTPVNNFRDLIQRKIYTYNCLSASIAYPGYYKGYTNYANAANDKDILKITDSIAEKLNSSISREFNVDYDEQEQFTLMALKKFRNEKIVDTIERNVGDVQRKLGKNERMIRPILLMKKYNFSTNLMEIVIACAVYYGGKQSDNKMKEEKLIFEHLEQHLPMEMVNKITQLYKQLSIGEPLSKIISSLIF